MIRQTVFQYSKLPQHLKPITKEQKDSELIELRFSVNKTDDFQSISSFKTIKEIINGKRSELFKEATRIDKITKKMDQIDNGINTIQDNHNQLIKGCKKQQKMSWIKFK
ncbi:Hypothetical_protein [Hexamita inflata]|uniref:Hypothetical_protein n=1 Tax=Hexamita inflata TaxID=28002 RepID=A0AA86QRP7_9EUKA|nr:Hypothetical protein HINF_LOCUS26431 [Hexamita inflata]CAI9964754.1 Hypothetical protein HINF_LOCUS52399 [Hexamita inflata]